MITPYTTKETHKVKEVRQIVVPQNMVEFPTFINQDDGMYTLLEQLSLLFDMHQYDYEAIVKFLKTVIRNEQKVRIKHATRATIIRDQLVADATARIDAMIADGLVSGAFERIQPDEVISTTPEETSIDKLRNRKYPIYDRLVEKGRDQDWVGTMRNPAKEEITVDIEDGGINLGIITVK